MLYYIIHCRYLYVPVQQKMYQRAQYNNIIDYITVKSIPFLTHCIQNRKKSTKHY